MKKISIALTKDQVMKNDGAGKMKKQRDVIKELSDLYFEKTGTSPELSFYGWCGAIELAENEQAWVKIIAEVKEYPERFGFEK